MKLNLVTAVAALVTCSGAWSEIIYLDCQTTNRELTEQGGYDRVFVIDTITDKVFVHYDYGYMATGTVEVIAGSFQLSFPSEPEIPDVEISRVTGKYRTTFVGSPDVGQCQGVDSANLKF